MRSLYSTVHCCCACSALRCSPALQRRRRTPSASRTSPPSPACAPTSWWATAWWSVSTAPATRPARRRSPSRASPTCWRSSASPFPPNANPQLKNVAAVTVTADLPPFAKTGQTIDVTVSSIGNASSLRGGSLLMTPLRGVDGQVYAFAQGSMVVSGFGVARQGRLARSPSTYPAAAASPTAPTVEREVPMQVRRRRAPGLQPEHARLHDRRARGRPPSTRCSAPAPRTRSMRSRSGSPRPSIRTSASPIWRRSRPSRSIRASRRPASSSTRAPAPWSSARTCKSRPRPSRTARSR